MNAVGRRLARGVLRKDSISWIVLVGLVAGLSAGCARRIDYHLLKYEQAFTQTNLHPDEQHGRLYSVNYQREGMIPVCTPVKIHVVRQKKMVFSRLDNGRQYEYLFHGSLRDPVPLHLDKYFGPGCPQKELDGLPAQDIAGIQNGKVYQNMTKRGVLFAIGYPPEHRTATLDQDVWTYWSSRFNTFEVHFKYGKVIGINE